MSENLIVIDESSPPWIRVIIDERSTTPFCVTINHETSSLPDLHEVVAASFVKGFYISNLVADFIRTNESEYAELLQRVKDVRNRPSTLMLELGAALQIREWELKGLIRADMGLPSSSAVLVALQLPTFTISDLTLINLVANRYHEHFMWTKLNEYGADTLIEVDDEHDFAMRIAKFLWSSQRHQL